MVRSPASHCLQLTALDVHYPDLSDVQGPVPAWAALSSLTALRSLHTSSGLGWTAGALAGLAAAAPCLRQVALTDNHRAVTDQWVQVRAALCCALVCCGVLAWIMRCAGFASRGPLWVACVRPPAAKLEGQRGAHGPGCFPPCTLCPAQTWL